MKKEIFRERKKASKNEVFFCNVAPFQNMKGNTKKERSAPSNVKISNKWKLWYIVYMIYWKETFCSNLSHLIHFKETSIHIYCKNAPNFNLPQHRESSLRHPCESRTIKMRKLYNGPFIDLVIFFCKQIAS